MSLVEHMQIATAVARAGGRLASDRLGDFTGRSQPWRADDVATPAVLTTLLEEGRLPGVLPPAQVLQVTGVHRHDIPSVSSNCHNLVLGIEQPPGGTLPDSLFVKLPMESLATRWFMNVINSWRLESHFFRHVARELPLRTPLTYATGYRGSRFFLVQEDLNADPSVRLFTNPDMMAGPPPEVVRRCLDTFARLHSHYHGLDALQREALLPSHYHLFLSPAMGAVARSLNRLALGPCMRKCPGRVPDAVAQAYRQSMRHWPRLLAYWFSEPLSLLHGDSHLGNFFVSGDDMGMLDWQAAHWGKGVRDVQYFLIDSLPAEQLAAQERELLQYYVERRALHGAPIDAGQAWQEYRSFTFHTLMTIVVSIGFGALNEEQDALMAEILDRAVAAVQRVDYPGWLAQFLAGD